MDDTLCSPKEPRASEGNHHKKEVISRRNLKDSIISSSETEDYPASLCSYDEEYSSTSSSEKQNTKTSSHHKRIVARRLSGEFGNTSSQNHTGASCKKRRDSKQSKDNRPLNDTLLSESEYERKNQARPKLKWPVDKYTELKVKSKARIQCLPLPVKEKSRTIVNSVERCWLEESSDDEATATQSNKVQGKKSSSTQPIDFLESPPRTCEQNNNFLKPSLTVAKSSVSRKPPVCQALISSRAKQDTHKSCPDRQLETVSAVPIFLSPTNTRKSHTFSTVGYCIRSSCMFLLYILAFRRDRSFIVSTQNGELTV